MVCGLSPNGVFWASGPCDESVSPSPNIFLKLFCDHVCPKDFSVSTSPNWPFRFLICLGLGLALGAGSRGTEIWTRAWQYIYHIIKFIRRHFRSPSVGLALPSYFSPRVGICVGCWRTALACSDRVWFQSAQSPTDSVTSSRSFPVGTWVKPDTILQ